MPMKPATNKASRKEEVEWIEYPAYYTSTKGGRQRRVGPPQGKITRLVADDLRRGHPRSQVASKGRMRRGRGICL